MKSSKQGQQPNSIGSFLGEIYSNHNSQQRGRGFVIFGKERGGLFAQWLGQGKKILDLGCRDCALTGYYARDNEILGLDIDQGGLDICREELGIQTKLTDLNGDWDIPANSFDAVVAAELLEHLYHPEEVLRKISDVLKSGGMLVGSVPHAFSLINRLRILSGRKEGTPLADPTHINHFSYRELEKMLRNVFDIVEIRPFTRFKLLGRIFPRYFSFLLLFRCEKRTFGR
ncbi:MAG: methyltransferase domain-containing protein [Candidatus Pacebacteria bacterium]|nr:methyltransferase domain-containing protein [Candidatus Paceibacterota bacterium]